MREEQREHDTALESARTEQAKARTAVMQLEKRIKRAEKTLENKRPDLAAVEAQTLHSKRKIETTRKTHGDAGKALAEQEAKLATLEKDLANTKKAGDEAQEKARKAASQGNIALSEESLQEYRRLKAEANLLAIDERQQLEALTRDEKTASRNVTLLQEKQNAFEEKLATREVDLRTQTEKKEELEEKLGSLQTELNSSKQELNNQQSERTRISQLEQQANEKLAKIYQDLLQAGVEKSESEREVRLKETISNLQRIFPGVRGRLSDLCKPAQRKYETAVSVVLGRNIDAVVVDEEKVAIDCIEVRLHVTSSRCPC